MYKWMEPNVNGTNTTSRIKEKFSLAVHSDINKLMVALARSGMSYAGGLFFETCIYYSKDMMLQPVSLSLSRRR